LYSSCWVQRHTHTHKYTHTSWMCAWLQAPGNGKTSGQSSHCASAALALNKEVYMADHTKWLPRLDTSCLKSDVALGGEPPHDNLTTASNTAKKKPASEQEMETNCFTWRRGEPAYIAVSEYVKGNDYQPDGLSAELLELKEKIKLMLFLSSPSDQKSCRKVPSCESFLGAHHVHKVTTMMIRNVPYALTVAALEQALQNVGFGDCFDFLYLPMKRNQEKNLGFAFLNFVSPEDAAVFKKAFHGYVFECPTKAGCRIRATVSEAHTQGYHANMMKLFDKLDGRRQTQPCEHLLSRDTVIDS